MPLDNINIFGEKNINLESRDEQIERLRQIIKSSSAPMLERMTGFKLPQGFLEDDFKDVVFNEVLKRANIPITRQSGEYNLGQSMGSDSINFSLNPNKKSVSVRFRKNFGNGGTENINIFGDDDKYGFTELKQRKKLPPDMYRQDGTTKSAKGFLGPIINNITGKTHTELSINFDDVLDGRKIPLLVPTLTQEEIDWFKNNNAEGNVGIVPDSIKQKAIKHAIERDKQGLDPFYQDDEESISNQAQNPLDDINIFKY